MIASIFLIDYFMLNGYFSTTDETTRCF